ncbi:Core histone macro-H2A.1 [Cystobasidiomycetes sp. EMM_F5]
MAAGKHGGKHIKIYDKDAPKRVTKAEKAGLIFPVSRMDRYLRKMHGKKYRIGETTPIYLAAVVEYLIAEVVELAGNAARDNNKQRIKGRHIMLAVSNDEELRLLLKHVTISEGGVMRAFISQLQSREQAFSADPTFTQAFSLEHETRGNTREATMKPMIQAITVPEGHGPSNEAKSSPKEHVRN